MMVNPYDDSRLMLALQFDHSRVAGFFAAHWGNGEFDRPEPYASVVLAAQETRPRLVGMGDEAVDAERRELSHGLPRRQLQVPGPAPASTSTRTWWDDVLQRDPYAAMLIAMHGVALMNAGYGKYTHPPEPHRRPAGACLRGRPGGV